MEDRLVSSDPEVAKIMVRGPPQLDDPRMIHAEFSLVQETILTWLPHVGK